MINPKGLLKFLPTIGIIVFIGIYIYASRLYPGGSIADINSNGFDWRNNHWCNLMRESGLNGIQNQARPVAIMGITILCFSMIIFFIQFANYFEKRRAWNIAIKVSGGLAMLSATFIFTKYHDVMTSILSICGTIVIIGMIRALHNNQLTFFKMMGIFCALIIGLNNFFYFKRRFNSILSINSKRGFYIDTFLDNWT